jgi:hemolysin activation/secretion protein
VSSVAQSSLAIAFLACLLASIDGSAQILIPDDRPGDERLELPDFEQPKEREPVLPPYRPQRPRDAEDITQGVLVAVREVRITGNSAISIAELKSIAAPYEGRELGFADLARLREALTQAYVERGFVTSGALLPDQTIRDGIVEIRIVEGRLEDIEIRTDGRLRPAYIRARLERERDRPLNVFELEKRLQLLQRDPRLERVQAQLLPAETRGLSILYVSIEEAPPFRVGADFSNARNPTIGALGGQVSASYDNLLGVGDGFFVRYEGSEGLDQVEVSVSIPLTRYDTLLTYRYQGSWADVVDDDFSVLDIKTESETFGIELRQPLYRSLRTSLETFLRGERRRAKSRIGLLGIGLPVPGADDGKTDVSVLRLGFEALHTSRKQVLSGRALLSWGIDALDSTVNSGSVPDSRFVSGLLQLQWARRLPWFGAEFVARYDMQVSNDALLTLEQFSIGGRYTVRGYRENQLVRDNGLIGSAEFRVPIYERVEPAVRIELVPFFDAGHSWSTDRGEFGQKTLMSVGIGTRMFFTRWGHLEFYWGHRLKDVSRVGEYDVQDDGIHFRIGVDWP